MSEQTLPSAAEKIARYLQRVLVPGWFGTISIGVQNGKVSMVKVEQTKKVEEL